MALQVRQQAIDRMIAHALAEAPNECCGLMLGADGVVREAIAARNLHRSPTQYRIDPADHFSTIRRARATGQTVIGAYHSHPRGPSIPSATDAAELTDPTLTHVIVSLATEPPSVLAFEWTGGNFAAIDLVPVA